MSTVAGFSPASLDHADVVVDLVLLGRGEQDVHVALAGQARALEDLVVQVDVLDVERDVLLGLPVDRLGQLGVAHHRQADALDDHVVAGQRGGHRASTS